MLVIIVNDARLVHWCCPGPLFIVFVIIVHCYPNPFDSPNPFDGISTVHYSKPVNHTNLFDNLEHDGIVKNIV